jgi:hypothetical protein
MPKGRGLLALFSVNVDGSKQSSVEVEKILRPWRK